jgi:hypothetical protein
LPALVYRRRSHLQKNREQGRDPAPNDAWLQPVARRYAFNAISHDLDGRGLLPALSSQDLDQREVSGSGFLPSHSVSLARRYRILGNLPPLSGARVVRPQLRAAARNPFASQHAVGEPDRPPDDDPKSLIPLVFSSAIRFHSDPPETADSQNRVPMRLSRYFLPILRETPKEAEIVSHRLLLRAGMVRQEAAGIYAFLPLGLRVLKKIEQIVREEQDRSGAIEMLMPTIQSADLWRESGRYEDYGKEMLRIQDRHERELLYGPTNEEMITEIFRAYIRSYKDLPLNLYHI